jgi:hypothetical protein
MLKTGNTFIDLFSLARVFAPLLPVLILFLRKTYQKDVLTYLLILCLIEFIGGTVALLARESPTLESSSRHVFSLLELVLLGQIAKTVVSARLGAIIDSILVAFTSSLLTFYLLKGVDRGESGIAFIEYGIMLLFMAAALAELVQADSMAIFQKPIFYIACGALFFSMVAALLEGISLCCPTVSMEAAGDKAILLDIADLVRYFFFVGAALCFRPPGGSD